MQPSTQPPRPQPAARTAGTARERVEREVTEQARRVNEGGREELRRRLPESLAPDRGDRRRPLRGLPSTAAVAGHPLHPMLIPFPITFLTAALASDLAAKATGDPFWSRTSRWMLGAGLIGGVLAGAVGAIDYFTIRRAREKPAGRIHAYGNSLALSLAAANLALRRDADDREGPNGGEIALSAATAAVLGVTGWAGGELSYTHMVGVAGYDDQHTHDEKRYVP